MIIRGWNVRQTEYGRFEDEFDFESPGSTYTAWTITLHPVVGGTAWTEDLDEDEFGLITKWFRVYQAEVGEYVFKEGEESSHFCLVAEGVVSISKEVPDEGRWCRS